MLTSFSVCQGEWGGPLPLPLLLNGSLSFEFQSEKERVGKKSDWRGDYIVTIWRKEKKKHVITKPYTRKAGSKVVWSDCENSDRWEEPEKERRKRGRQPRRWREEKLNECFRFLLFFFPSLPWVFLISPNKFISAAVEEKRLIDLKKKDARLSATLTINRSRCTTHSFTCNRSRSLGGRVVIQFLKGEWFSVRATSVRSRGQSDSTEKTFIISNVTAATRVVGKWHKVELMPP